MNTQKRTRRTTKQYISKNTDNSWNNIKETIKILKAQKKTMFEEKFVEVINLIRQISLSLHPEIIQKTIITTLPRNVKPGEIIDIFINGKFFKIKVPTIELETGTSIRIPVKYTRNVYEEICDLIRIRKAYNIKYKMGLIYGYPKCCVNDYVIRMVNDQAPEAEEIQAYAGQYGGYVPCMKCTNKIIREKIPLEKIIKNRIYKKYYPCDDEPGHVRPCKKHARLMFLNKITIDEVIKSGCKDCYINDDDDDDIDNDYDSYMNTIQRDYLHPLTSRFTPISNAD
jgi:hypothetical protein